MKAMHFPWISIHSNGILPYKAVSRLLCESPKKSRLCVCNAINLFSLFSPLYRLILNKLEISQGDCLTVFTILLYLPAKGIFQNKRSGIWVRILWSHWPPLCKLQNHKTSQRLPFSSHTLAHHL